MLCLSGLFVYLCISPIIYYYMQLTHIAIWTNELERSREFYTTYFNGKSNEKYVNPKKGFASYFVTFEGWSFYRSCSFCFLCRFQGKGE